MNDEYFMRKALKEAEKGMMNKDGGPFGCVIVKDGKIITKAHNTVLKNNNPTQHAEINAISKASKKLKNQDLNGCILYSSVEPCPMCLSAIHWAKIGKVVYGATIDDSNNISGFNEIHLSDKDFNKIANLNITLIPGILKDDAKELLKRFKSLGIKTY